MRRGLYIPLLFVPLDRKTAACLGSVTVESQIQYRGSKPLVCGILHITANLSYSIVGCLHWRCHCSPASDLSILLIGTGWSGESLIQSRSN